MNPKDVQIGRYYRTHSGTICKVTAINDGEDKVISYVPYTDQMPGPADQMPAVLFTANLDEEVQADTQGKPVASLSSPPA